MEQNYGLRNEQQQTLSAGQVQSLQILSLTNQELETFLTKEYIENPMLDNVSDKENELLTDVEKLWFSRRPGGNLPECERRYDCVDDYCTPCRRKGLA